MNRKQKWFSRILGITILIVCLVTGGVCAYRTRFVSVDGIRYEKNITSIDLSGRPVGDLNQLQALENLGEIDLRGTGLSCDEYEQVKSWFPQAEILWQIPFQGTYYPTQTETLTLTFLTEDDLAVIPYFTALKTVNGEQCPDYKNLHLLRQTCPDLDVTYRVPVGTETVGYDIRELTLAGAEVEELAAVLPFLTELESVKLTAPLAPVDQLTSLAAEFSYLRFSWELELAGFTLNDQTETLDLTGIPLTVEEMDAVLPYLPKLTFVDMTDCGISNEEMDALNARYEDVKIVWTVTLGRGYRIRTDITAFMPAKYDYYPSGNDLENLRYCHDMVAIDLGHRSVSNCEFAAYMPHLKYLILAETCVRDLTPLTGLTELVYLELFLNGRLDLTPLTTLTALEDLNLHFTQGDPEIVAQMTWLKNLWWGHVQERALTREQQKMLREAIPDCNFNFRDSSSTGEGWRDLPNYFAQRDLFGMHYMKG